MRPELKRRTNMKALLALLMFCGCLGLAHAATQEPPARSQQEVANRILRAGNIAARRGDKKASAEANAAAQSAREAPTLEGAEQIYKNFNKRNN
jgi:hypothetical protein